MELAYAVQNRMTYAKLKNKAGKFVSPSEDATTAAAAGALKKMPADFKIMITNASGIEAYPIAGFTWLLLRTEYDKEKGKTLVDLLDWIYGDGQKMAQALHYAPLPDSLVKKIKAKYAAIKY